MPLISTLAFQWYMGHRIPQSRCDNIHGHLWHARIEFADDEQLDLEAVRTIVDDHLSQYLAGGCMVDQNDPLVDLLMQEELKHAVVNGSPTPALVAKYFAEYLAALVAAPVLRISVGMDSAHDDAVWMPDPLVFLPDRGVLSLNDCSSYVHAIPGDA